MLNDGSSDIRSVLTNLSEKEVLDSVKMLTVVKVTI